eukprot:3214855-Rhodomonas_salina.1
MMLSSPAAGRRDLARDASTQRNLRQRRGRSLRRRRGVVPGSHNDIFLPFVPDRYQCTVPRSKASVGIPTRVHTEFLVSFWHSSLAACARHKPQTSLSLKTVVTGRIDVAATDAVSMPGLDLQGVGPRSPTLPDPQLKSSFLGHEHKKKAVRAGGKLDSKAWLQTFIQDILNQQEESVWASLVIGTRPDDAVKVPDDAVKVPDDAVK